MCLSVSDLLNELENRLKIANDLTNRYSKTVSFTTLGVKKLEKDLKEMPKILDELRNELEPLMEAYRKGRIGEDKIRLILISMILAENESITAMELAIQSATSLKTGIEHLTKFRYLMDRARSYAFESFKS